MKRLSFFILSIALAGCGNKYGNVTTPLTKDQQATFSNTLESVGRTEKAGENGQREHNAVGDSTTQQMVQALQAGNCEYKLPSNQTGNTTNPMSSNVETGLQVFGSTCPIALDVNVKITNNLTQTSYDANIDFNLKYEVKDAEFAKLNDVTFMDIKGSGSVTAKTGSMNGNITVEGAVKSNAEGDLKMYYAAKVDGSGGQGQAKITSEQIWGIEYPKFTAELKMTTVQENSAVKTTYAMNGTEVTAQEFQALLTKAGSIGALRLPGVQQ